jgi:hypothetical protein
VKICLIAFLAVARVPIAANAEAAARPNRVTILAVDFGYGSANG